MEIKAFATLATKIGPKVAPICSWAVKHAPAILAGTGIASIIGGEVLAGWGTLKAKEVLASDIPMELEREEDKKQFALAKGAKVVGYYTPAIVATGLGVGLIIKGHSVQQARIASAIAAYSALATSFSEYRRRVIEEGGAAADVRYYYGEHLKKTDIYYDAEDGKKPKKHKEEVVFRDKTPGSPYAAIFDDVSPDWTKNREQNLYFLKCQCVAANMKLQRQGYLFLNDVLSMIGLPYNPAGQFVGWIDEAYEGSVDGIVDFGIDYAYLEDELDRAQEEGRNPEPSLWLDFNVDGEIWDKIPLVKKQVR